MENLRKHSFLTARSSEKERSNLFKFKVNFLESKIQNWPDYLIGAMDESSLVEVESDATRELAFSAVFRWNTVIRNSLYILSLLNLLLDIFE